MKTTATHDEKFTYEYWNKLGFVVGLGRDFPHPKKSHIYRGTFSNIGSPMCKKGWNRDGGEGYSIWRNNVGVDGICFDCIKNARKEMKQGIVIEHLPTKNPELQATG